MIHSHHIHEQWESVVTEISVLKEYMHARELHQHQLIVTRQGWALITRHVGPRRSRNLCFWILVVFCSCLALSLLFLLEAGGTKESDFLPEKRMCPSCLRVLQLAYSWPRWVTLPEGYTEAHRASWMWRRDTLVERPSYMASCLDIGHWDKGLAS